jgi:polyisoprenoid-binding protein YceI
MSAAIGALVCKVQGTLPLASLSAASLAPDEVLYRIDGRHGPMQCSLRQCGMFATNGDVTRFTSDLAVEREATRVSRLDLSVDLGSFVPREWQQRGAVPVASLRDLVEAPLIRFRSSAVAACGDSGQVVRGLLDIGGVTSFQGLDLTVSSRRPDPITGTDLIDLSLSGRFSQTALGIALSNIVMSTDLDLQLKVAVELEG